MLQGLTPLHTTAFGQRTDKAELLLANGADVNARAADVGSITHPAAFQNPSFGLHVTHQPQLLKLCRRLLLAKIAEP